MLVLDAGIGDKKQDVDAIEDVLQRGLVVVVGLSNGGALLRLLGESLGMSRDEGDGVRIDEGEEVREGAAAQTPRGREDSGPQ